MEFESRTILRILLKTLLRTLASGYSIYVFESSKLERDESAERIRRVDRGLAHN